MKPYYDHDGITIYHGDCLALLPCVQADVMISDPPYGMSYRSGYDSESQVRNDDSTECRDAALREWGGPALVFGRWNCSRPPDVKALLIWDKGDWPGMGDLSLPWGPSTEEIYVIGGGYVGKRTGQIIRDPKRPTGNKLHPTEKPIGLMEILLRSRPVTDVVVDPFMGAGSTLVAAKNLGMRAIGIEVEEKYCRRAIGRLSQGVLPL